MRLRPPTRHAHEAVKQDEQGRRRGAASPPFSSSNPSDPSVACLPARPHPAEPSGHAATPSTQPTPTRSPHHATAEQRTALRPRQRLLRGQDQPRQPQRHPRVELRRGQEARDHQLPHVQAREGRLVLRADLRSREGLRVRLRQVQGHEVQGHHLRPVQREGHAQPRPPQADGPPEPRRTDRPHLVLQGDPLAPGQPAGHEDQRPGEGHLLPGLRRDRSRRHPAQGAAGHHRGRVPAVRQRVRLQLRRHDGRRGDQGAAGEPRPARHRGRAAGGPGGDALQAEDQGPRRSV